MKEAWLEYARQFAEAPSNFYSGARKILRNTQMIIEPDEWRTNDLMLEDAGYTKSKLRYLERAYLHEESRRVAVQLWERRCEQAKYGSVGFTCYNHFIKTDPNKKSKRASVMGPCIQAVTLTWVTRQLVGVDVFYRTTEFYKKFPADLYFLRNVLMSPFKLDATNVKCTIHFANVTMHPMYFVTLVPHLSNPTFYLESLRKKQAFFHDWVVKWSARYVCPEYHRGIAKFAQALRVQKDALNRIDPKTLKRLRQYLKENHPGHRNEYVEEDNDE